MNEIEGRRVVNQEWFPIGYDYRRRFPDVREYAGREGGAVYIADGPDGYFVITDEGSMAEFLEDDSELISIRKFDSAVARDAFCAATYGELEARNRTGEPEGDHPPPRHGASS